MHEPCRDDDLISDRIRWAGRTWQVLAEPSFAAFHPPEAPWHDPERLAGHPGAAKVQPRRQVIRVTAEGRQVFVKHYIFTGLLHRVKRTLRGCRARQEFDVGRACLRRGIATGQPLWTARRRAGGLIAESFLVTSAVDGVPVERFYDALQEAQRLPFLAAVGRELARFHALGFYHDDLKGWHLLAAGRSAEEAAFCVIDLHNCGFHRRVSRRRRTNNLYQVLRSLDHRAADPELRRALLHAYREAAGTGARGVDEAAIGRIAREKAARRGPGAHRPDIA